MIKISIAGLILYFVGLLVCAPAGLLGDATRRGRQEVRIGATMCAAGIVIIFAATVAIIAGVQP